MGERAEVRSIADLARIADVSISTVSRALTGKGTLNPDTRERIQSLAALHGFQLNVAAQNLRLGRTGAIAVLLPLGHERSQHMSDPFFTAMLGHLAEALAGHGYDLLLSRVIPDQPDWLDVFSRSGRVDGTIVIGQSDQHDALNRVASRYRPLVVWGALSPDNGYTTVGTDNHAGGALVAQHLLSRGRKRLAFFGHPSAPEFVHRHAGFLAGLPEAIRANTSFVPVPLSGDACLDAARAWFAQGNRPDGIFAASDVIGLSVAIAAGECGLRLPADLSLVGFDDLPVARLARPPLTTVRQDVAGGAQMLVDLLVRRIGGTETQSVEFPPALVVRESS